MPYDATTVNALNADAPLDTEGGNVLGAAARETRSLLKLAILACHDGSGNPTGPLIGGRAAPGVAFSADQLLLRVASSGTLAKIALSDLLASPDVTAVIRSLSNVTAAVKPGLTVRTGAGGTTLAGDAELTLSLAASSRYAFEFGLFFSCSSGGDMKVRAALPGDVSSLSSETAKLNGFTGSPVGSTSGQYVTGTPVTTAGGILFTFGDNPTGELMVSRGAFITASAGTFQVQYATRNSSGTLNVYPGSYLRLTRV
jgi:hypothetical protein